MVGWWVGWLVGWLVGLWVGWFRQLLSGLFELACWKLKVMTGEWERKDPPSGFTTSTAVDWEANPPTVKCTTDTFSPYSIRATRKNIQQQALFFF